MKPNFSVRTIRIFFAISMIAWGILHFITGQFVGGRAQAWVSALLPMHIVPYVSGLIFVAAGVAILIERGAGKLTAIAGWMVLILAAIPNLILIIQTLDYGGLLTLTNKSLTIGFGALLIAAGFQQENFSAPDTTRVAPKKNFTTKMASATRFIIGLFLFSSGIQHFLYVDFVKMLVPVWIPGAVFWTYFSAVALILSGFALMSGIKYRVAAWLAGLMIFVWLILLHIPRAVAGRTDYNEWTAVFEALAVSALLLLLTKSAINGAEKNSHSL
jgi:uncharacterized membrane protein